MNRLMTINRLNTNTKSSNMSEVIFHEPISKTGSLEKMQNKLSQINELNLEKYYEFQTKITNIINEKEKLRILKIEHDDKVSKYKMFIEENRHRHKKTTEYYNSDREIIETKQELLAKLYQDIKLLQIKNKKYANAIGKMAKYNDFITAAIDLLPNDYIKGLKENEHPALIRRFYTLYYMNELMHENLKDNMNKLMFLIKARHKLQMKQTTVIINHNSQFPKLRRELAKATEEFNRTENQYSEKYNAMRDKTLTFGRLLQSVNNITNKCMNIVDKGKIDYDNMQLSPKLQVMEPDEKFEKIQEFIISTSQILEHLKRSSSS